MIYNTEMKSDENCKTQTGQDLREILNTKEEQIQKLKAQIELLTETNRKQAEDMVMLQKRQSELQCRVQSATEARELEALELKKKLDEANIVSEKLRNKLEMESCLRKESSRKADREQAFEPATEVVWVMWNNFKKQYNALRSEIDWAEDNMKRHFSAQRALLDQQRREMRKFLEEADDLLYQDDESAELVPVEEFDE